MGTPTLDQINTAAQAWVDGSLGTGAIGQNTDAYNQIYDQLSTLGGDIFASIDDVSEGYATDTLTLTPGAIADDKVEIGGVWYVFASSMSGGADGTSSTPWKVNQGANDTAAFAALRKAINATGVAGTDYSTGLTANPLATATASNATTLSARAIAVGTDGNAITASVTTVNSADGLAWGTATFTGGTGDDVDGADTAIDNWRDTLRAVPLEADDGAVTQLDAAIPTLKTSIASLYTP